MTGNLRVRTKLNRHSERRCAKRECSPQDGFTLVELLIVLILTPLVLGGITAGLLSMFTTEKSVSATMDRTSRAQVASQRLSTDFQIADGISSAPTPSCGPLESQVGNATVSLTQIIAFRNDENQETTAYTETPTVVGYIIKRITCNYFDPLNPTSVSTIGISKDPLQANISCNSLIEAGFCRPSDFPIPTSGISSISVPLSSTSNLVAASQMWTPEQPLVTVNPPPNATSAVPRPPTVVEASPGDSQATVTWNPPSGGSDSPVLSYLVKTVSGEFPCTISAPQTTCTVNGLTNDTSYSFVVKAKNSAGWSDASEPSNSVTPKSEFVNPTPIPPDIVPTIPPTVESPLILLQKTQCPVAEFGDKSTLTVSGGSGLFAINAECSPAVAFSTGALFHGRGWKAHKRSKVAVSGQTPLVKVNAIQDIGDNFQDPFLDLPAPMVEASGVVKCSGNICPQGIYNELPNLSSGKFRFTGGNYVFNVPVVIGGAKKNFGDVTFGDGNYNFTKGFIESGYAKVEFSTGLAIFSGQGQICNAPTSKKWKESKDQDDFWKSFNENSSGCSNGPNSELPISQGVSNSSWPALSIFGHSTLRSGGMLNGKADGMLFYISSGGLSLQSSGFKGSAISLTGSSRYRGISIWDVAPTSPGVSQAIFASSTRGEATSIGGIYVPRQPVVIGQGGKLNASFMVVDSLKMIGNGELNVG